MKFFYFLFVIVLVTIPSMGLSQTVKEKSSLLRIGTMDLRPYGWKDSKKVKHGIIFEMNEEIGKRLGIPYENRILPFKRMLRLLNQGSIDIISAQAHAGALNAGEKLEVQFDINVIAATRKGSNIKKIEDFKGKNLVFHRSASYTELEGLPRDIVYVNGYQQVLGFLHRNIYADGGVFSEPAYYYWMKNMNLTPKDFGNVIMITANKKQWIFTRRDLNEELKSKVKAIVKEVYKEDLYQNLLIKYGKGNY